MKEYEQEVETRGGWGETHSNLLMFLPHCHLAKSQTQEDTIILGY